MGQELIKDIGFADLRLPYAPDLGDAFGIDNVRWKVLTDAIFPGASTVDSIIMALTYCKARNLDVFKRPVHIVPMWSTLLGKMVETVWPSIAELRTTAFRTGLYAGRDKTEFGPMVKEKVGKVEIEHPEFAQVTVYRIVGGQRCAFPGPQVDWLEAYARAKRDDDSPNAQWQKRPRGQIEKCAEAAALRGAFPEEIGNEYAAEEMEGQRIFSDQEPRDVTPKRVAPPPVLSVVPPSDIASTQPVRRAPPPPQCAPAIDPAALQEKFATALCAAFDEETANDAYTVVVGPHEKGLADSEVEEFLQMLRNRVAEFEP